MGSKQFSRDLVAQHASVGDLWVIIDSRVFDLSSFASAHPGGLAVLLDKEIAGQDATESFYALHRAEVRDRYAHLQIGTIEDEQPEIKSHVLGSLSDVPYAEPSWLSKGFHSPYYKDHHRRFQAAVRLFAEKVVFPDAQARERGGGKPSQEIFDEMARLNILAMRIGPGKHLEGRVLMDGIISVEFDAFHGLIITQEFSRLHARGYSDGLAGGTIIGLPPIINFAQPALRDRIVAETLSGKKSLCLAVTEAFAGSDVQGLKCRATRVEGGWVVNGTKKWITNAMWAAYFTVACVDKDSGEIVVLVVERGEGVQTKPIQTSYSSSAAGTAYVTFDNVFVFSHQARTSTQSFFRWVLVSNSIAVQRIIFEECFKWAMQRKVFGKPLNSQAVVRQKLAAMITRFESCQSWLENITFQMTLMSPKEQAQHLAGQIAFLKMHATRAAQTTAADAVQIFGGRGLTQTGMGRFIEHTLLAEERRTFLGILE
ncbi:acyl-CoA dehydrogenase/oxidase [Mycena epipterygia]|nr:acyl-CoA dehydrogenase/oxidase [Mycena epipterygia]